MLPLQEEKTSQKYKPQITPTYFFHRHLRAVLLSVFSFLVVYVRQKLWYDIVRYVMFGLYKIYKNAGLTLAIAWFTIHCPSMGRIL